MPGVFDRLQQQIESKAKEGGITALDLADLPSALRKIMRLMLRQLEMSHSELSKAMQEMPEDQRLNQKDFDQAITLLCDQQWLIRFGEGEKATYKVNLRRKAGSTLSSSVWSALNERLDQPQSDETE